MSRFFALAMVVVLALASTGSPATASVAVSEYADLGEAGIHRASIEALEAEGILAGTECRTARFCPDDPLPRWVMAVWMVRSVEDQAPPDIDGTIFADVDSDAWWASYVQRLWEVGITRGCAVGPVRYCGNQPVTRGQMASFLNRAFGLARILGFEGAGFLEFTDIEGSAHALSIQALAASGITIGCATNPLRYCPERSVTRAEMATFLARALRLVPTLQYVEDPGGEGILHLVSRYTTFHPCCAPRVTNIQLFAEMVDGAVVAPGNRFSLNRHVGERTTEKGFVEAGTLISGRLVDTVGGGVSQFATTFYNAVFWGGYEDVAHQPHSSYFSRYPEGVEATLDWPGLDVIFRNDTSRNVLIRTEYTSTSLTVKLFGDNDGRSVAGEWKDGRGHSAVVAQGGSDARVVTAETSRRLRVTAPPAPLYRSNPELRVDQRRYLQPAVDGWTVRVSRTITQGDKQRVQWWAIRYRPLQAIIEVHPCVLTQTCPTLSK